MPDYKIKTERGAVIFFMLLLIYIALLFSSCGYRFASKFFDKHEEEALQYYDSRFPAIQYYLPGKWSYDTSINYVPKNIDVNVSTSILPKKIDTIIEVRTIKKSKTDTIRFTDNKSLQKAREKIKQLQDKIIALKTENSNQKSEISKLKSSKKTWVWIAIAAIGIIVAGGAGWWIGKSKLL